MSRFAKILFILLPVFFAAPEIRAQFGSVTFSNIRAYGFTVSFTSVVNADGFVCLRATQPMSAGFIQQNFGAGSGLNNLPEKGSGIGFAKVIHSPAPPVFNMREVVENTTYYFAFIPYRVVNSQPAFITDSALTAQATSSASIAGNYYSGINFNAPNLISNLTQLLQSHNFIDYITYRNTVVPVIFERDTSGNQKTVNCQYSGETKIYSGNFDFVALEYSREHLMPRSWMPTGGATTTTEGADYHNLALTNLNNANSLRSNIPYGNVAQTTNSFLECKRGLNTAQKTVFEPRAAMKGDAARAVFYQILCYNGTGGNWAVNDLPSFGPEQDVEVLLNWHFNDPPDAFEKAKHEYIYSLQNNRNPFIDFPELANCIDFRELLKTGTCATVETQSPEPLPLLSVFPNPVKDKIFFKLENQRQPEQFILIDARGKILQAGAISPNENTIALENLKAGFYVVRFSFSTGELMHFKFLKAE